MRQGRRPTSVGAWLSLKYSSIVVLTSAAAITATATAFGTQMSWLHDTNGVLANRLSAPGFTGDGAYQPRVFIAACGSFQSGSAVKGSSTNRQRRRHDELLFGRPSVLISLAGDVPGRFPVWSRLFDPPPRMAYLISAAKRSSGISVWSSGLSSTVRQRYGAGCFLMVGATAGSANRSYYYYMTITKYLSGGSGTIYPAVLAALGL